MVSWQKVRRMALALPGTEEGQSFGTDAFRVRKKLLARRKEDGDSMIVKLDVLDREVLIETQPKVYSVTDHYRNHPWVIVQLATVDPKELQQLLEDAWRELAAKRSVAAYDAGKRA